MNVKNEKLYATMKDYVAAVIEFVTMMAEASASALSVFKEDDYFATCWMEARLMSDPSELSEYAACLKELNKDSD